MKVGQRLGKDPVMFRVVVNNDVEIILSRIGTEIPNAEIAVARIDGKSRTIVAGCLPTKRNIIIVECENGEIIRGVCRRIDDQYVISKMTIKILFLDVDGVLNNNRVFMESNIILCYGEEQLDYLKKIIIATEARIVLSSSWRLGKGSLSEAEQILAKRGLFLIDSTPNLGQVERAAEIKKWLADFKPPVSEGIDPFIRFAILDDDAGAGIGFEGHFFKTTMEEGLTAQIADKVVKYLNQ